MASPRLLIVVRRDRPALYANLQRSYQGNPNVEVILDRRLVGGRDAGATEDRRHPDRRALWTAPEAGTWEIAGFRVIYRDQDVSVHEEEHESRWEVIRRPREPSSPEGSTSG